MSNIEIAPLMENWHDDSTGTLKYIKFSISRLIILSSFVIYIWFKIHFEMRFFGRLHLKSVLFKTFQFQSWEHFRLYYELENHVDLISRFLLCMISNSTFSWISLESSWKFNYVHISAFTSTKRIIENWIESEEREIEFDGGREQIEKREKSQSLEMRLEWKHNFLELQFTL